jgi:uncharacterized protein
MGAVPRFLETLVAQLAARPDVRRIVLFGSRARGENGARSDVDLAVDAPGVSATRWAEIEAAIEDAETLLKIDLVRLDEATDELRERVLREGVVLHGQ